MNYGLIILFSYYIERQQIIQSLEDSVLKLSETYPLFLYSVWKVVAHLSWFTFALNQIIILSLWIFIKDMFTYSDLKSSVLTMPF